MRVFDWIRIGIVVAWLLARGGLALYEAGEESGRHEASRACHGAFELPIGAR